MHQKKRKNAQQPMKITEGTEKMGVFTLRK